jgi:MYXO-CTERM domain-containing protein
MRRRGLITAAVWMWCAAAHAGVDLPVTQAGATFTFGDRRQLHLDDEDELLLYTNNVLASLEQALVDASLDVHRAGASGGDLGEIVVINDRVRGVFDRMVGRLVLQLLWINQGRDEPWDELHHPGSPSILPFLAAWPAGSSGGQSAKKPASLTSTSIPDDPEEIPEPAGAAALGLMALGFAAVHRPRRTHA